MAFSMEEKCLLWLSAGEVTAHQWKILRETYDSATALWNAFSQEGEKLFQGGQSALLGTLHSESAMEELTGRLTKSKVTVLFRESKDYPELLKEIEDPPYVLYCAGDLSALTKPMIAVIGTRKPSTYGRDMGRKIAKGLAKAGVCVVSGLAYGIDSAAHEGALEGNGTTVAVLGSGINVPYPQEHIPLLRKIAGNGGLAMSEYPLDARPLPGHFPHRNRIISGLSRGLVFVEGKVKSGGMITVSTALAQGRDVFAVPGQVGTSGAEGPHTILREGARIVTCAEDVLEDMGLWNTAESEEGPRGIGSREVSENRSRTRKHQESAGSDPMKGAILEALGREAMTLDRLEAETGQTADRLIPILSIMEIYGEIRKEPGNLFSLPV